MPEPELRYQSIDSIGRPGPLIASFFDFPQHDGGVGFLTALRAGFGDPGLPLFAHQVEGHPRGTEANVRSGFAEVAASRCVVVVGPSISDNGVVVRDLADAAEIACINYTGGEITRSHWMFHYQVGSLEEEPILLAQHLAARSTDRVGLIYDDSIVGRKYAEWFRRAATNPIAAECAVSPTPVNVTAEVAAVSDCDVICYLGLGVAARAVAVTLRGMGWSKPVVANSALMFGYIRKDWRADWEGWTYVDTIADDNPQRIALKQVDPKTAAGSVGVAGYDIGRILRRAFDSLDGPPTRESVRDALERVKRMPATSGHPGTTMGFGVYDHGALKGDYLVLRQWRDGKSVQL